MYPDWLFLTVKTAPLCHVPVKSYKSSPEAISFQTSWIKHRFFQKKSKPKRFPFLIGKLIIILKEANLLNPSIFSFRFKINWINNKIHNDLGKP